MKKHDLINVTSPIQSLEQKSEYTQNKFIVTISLHPCYFLITS